VFLSASAQAPLHAILWCCPVYRGPLRGFVWYKLGLIVWPGTQDMAKLATATTAQILQPRPFLLVYLFNSVCSTGVALLIGCIVKTGEKLTADHCQQHME
jgi:hypothetical protein